MGAQYPTDNQYDWRSSQFQHCNMFPQSAYNQDYSRSDYTALLETNYALAQAQITQVQINQVTTFSRMKDDNSYPPTAHTQMPNNNICREKMYTNYPPSAHSGGLGIADTAQKNKVDTHQNSNSPNIINTTTSLPNSNTANMGSSSYNWIKNEDWNHGNGTALLPNIVNEQQQIQNYYHSNAQRNYWT